MNREVGGNSRGRILFPVTAKEICCQLQAQGSPERALVARRYFKTAPGQYGAGDTFAGWRVPDVRKLAKECQNLSLTETTKLLHSPWHEARLLALFILIRLYATGDSMRQEQIYNLFLRNTRYINNWDLVDASAEHIVGAHLRCRSRAPLCDLAKSSLLWERRISILSTFHYIKRGEFAETLQIAELLLRDREDLIHKAVGWMLREVGKREQKVEENFLQEHYQTMPRTMLRYAIEKFPQELRRQYLRGEI